MKQENLYTPKCIRTHSGQYVNVFDPDPNTIIIEDIAHALARLPRFGGHLPVDYSVARHSIACCEMAGIWNLELLMHDASEAMLVDLPRTIKQEIAQYKVIEDGLTKVLAAKFGFQYPYPAIVHTIDDIMLRWEWNHVFLKKHSWWGRLRFLWQHQFQKKKFLEMYHKLKHTNGAQYL